MHHKLIDWTLLQRSVLSQFATTHATLPSYSSSNIVFLVLIVYFNHISVKIKVGKWRKVISWTLSLSFTQLRSSSFASWAHFLQSFQFLNFPTWCCLARKFHLVYPFHINWKCPHFYLLGLANDYIANRGFFCLTRISLTPFENRQAAKTSTKTNAA